VSGLQETALVEMVGKPIGFFAFTAADGYCAHMWRVAHHDRPADRGLGALLRLGPAFGDQFFFFASSMMITPTTVTKLTVPPVPGSGAPPAFWVLDESNGAAEFCINAPVGTSSKVNCVAFNCN
jgi:hypothetical protein